MSELLKLSGRQIQILREGIVGAYPHPDDLWILLFEQMEVKVSAIARGDTYQNKVFSLIQDFEANGRIEEFIRVVVNDKPESPYLKSIKNEFASILVQDNTDEEKRVDIQLVIDKTLEEDANVKKYREQVKRYLSDHILEDYERALLDVLRDELGLSSEKANQIVEEELAPIYQARQVYERRLKAVIKFYPFSEEVKSELKKFQAQSNLTDREVNEISQPILDQAEIAYQEKLQPQPIVTPAPTSSILLSARGIDYSELEELFRASKNLLRTWRDAEV
jgi:hypothetical protein